MISKDSLKSFLIILPGFFSQKIYQYFFKEYKGSDVDTIFTALSFTLINFLLAYPCFLFVSGIRDRKTKRETDFKSSPLFLTIIFIISIFTGLGWALVESKGWLFEIGITEKYSRYDVWTKVFSTNEEGVKSLPLPDNKDPNKWESAFIKVELDNGKEYMGWPLYYSWQDEKNNSIFLKPAFSVSKDGDCKAINGPGVLLFEKKVKYIEFFYINEEALKRYRCLKQTAATASDK